MIVKTKLLSLLVLSALYVAIFIASLHFPTDPDLGWHLKYGEYFFENQSVLKENPYTNLMPDYKWNNSSWATDLVTYQAFNQFGFLGLSFLGALLVTATFFFYGRAAKLNLFEKSIIFPVILYFTNPVNQVAFRGQLISLFFIAIMYFILSLYDESRKKIVLLLIPLFVLWSNFHGQFILGLALLAIWGLVFIGKEIYLNYRTDFKRLFRDHKILFITIIGTAFAVLLNPFGVGVYIEAIGHFEDPLQSSVTEFLPPDTFSTVWWHLLLTGSVLAIGLALMGLGKKTLDKAPFYIPSLILFIFTFWVRRYAWPFYYSSIFLFKPVINFLKPESERATFIMSSMFTVVFLATVLWSRQPFDHLKNMNWDNYCINTVNCSPTAAKAVVDNNLNNEKLLTIYDFGGWLIWNYPQIKPTIDGRMHLWRNEKGYSAFEYYYKVEQNQQDVNESPYNAVLTSVKKPIYNRLVTLSREGKWRAIHIDDYAAVFIRNTK